MNWENGGRELPRGFRSLSRKVTLRGFILLSAKKLEPNVTVCKAALSRLLLRHTILTIHSLHKHFGASHVSRCAASFVTGSSPVGYFRFVARM
jgi:hypothetical protein